MIVSTTFLLELIVITCVKASNSDVFGTNFGDNSVDTPQNISVEATSSTSVSIKWEPPGKEGSHGPIQEYKIRYKQKGVHSQTVTTEKNRRVYELTNLKKGATYNIKIAAIYANGTTGPFSETHTVTTFDNDLDESQVPDEPGSLSAKASGTSIHVSWTPPKNANIMIRGYTIGWGVGVPDVYERVVDAKQRTFTIDHLQPSVEYVISLRATNKMGVGQPMYEAVKTMEATTEPPTPILPPVGLKAVVLSSESVVLFWTDISLPRNHQNNPDGRYYVARYTNNIRSRDQKWQTCNSTRQNCMIENLRPNTQYEFSVKTVIGKHESTWSMSVLNTTMEAQPSSPPRDLTIVSSNNGDPSMIFLHWQPPKQPNGQITGYVIFYTTDNKLPDQDWVVEAVVGDKMTAVLKDLVPDTVYYFKIQARNNKGYGPFSKEASFKTLSASVKPSPISENKGPFGDTLYIIIASVSAIATLCLLVIIVIFCKSCNNNMGNLRKHKGYTAAATSPGGKSKSNRDLKPPDLWIHHDHIELKGLDKGQNPDGSLTGTSMPRNSQELPCHDEILEKSRKNASYSDMYDDLNKTSPTDTSMSMMSGTSTARRGMRAKPIMIPVDTQPSLQTSATVSFEPSTGLSRPVYPKTQYNVQRAHVTLDNGDGSSHHLYDPVASPSVHLGICGTAPGAGHVSSSNVSYSMGNPVTSPTSNTLNRRLMGHNPLKSFSVPSPPNTQGTSQPKHLVATSTNSPQKKTIVTQGSTSSMSNNGYTSSKSYMDSPNNRIHGVNPTPKLGLAESLKKEDDVVSTYSTEELNQEMANIEGLMKDLNAITASEFEVIN